ncbi:MAG: 2-amino-4-hydroxy-6-hydroxymethyldihydropteridine diphosphokinase [Candidatus Kariarchaeaceae archaeon]|jgi:2-amino-4-hydroxy-6-hydroxymethyldihydropteridine diphosphokinase
MNNHVFISLGSNINALENILSAVSELGQIFSVKAKSKIYKSKAFGNPKRPDYLNAAVLIETEIKPVELKFNILRKIENDLGRIRSKDKFASRTIDLDIAIYGDMVINDEEDKIIIPDPYIEERAFLALPLADLSPEYLHPISKRTLESIASKFKSQIGKEIHIINIDL